MEKEIRTIVYDGELRVEAYYLGGIVRAFPNHFHDYYVIGTIENGSRRLSCKNRDFILQKGDIVLFNPGDNHACSHIGSNGLDYRGLNIPADVMQSLAEELTESKEPPFFSHNVVRHDEIKRSLLPLHQMIMEGSHEFCKEERLLVLVSLMMEQYGTPYEDNRSECRYEIETACSFIEENYTQRISLDQICRRAGMSKSALLRAFTKYKGITPYCYLENIRIGKAKKLLEQGFSPIDAALQTGFSDQSHFTNFFSRFIGLPPGVYRDIFSGSTAEKGNSYDK